MQDKSAEAKRILSVMLLLEPMLAVVTGVATSNTAITNMIESLAITIAVYAGLSPVPVAVTPRAHEY